MTDRSEAVQAAMDHIRRIEEDLGVTREGVEAIRQRLIELSNQRHLFPLADFPPPGPDEEQSNILYRLAQGDDDRFALYAQSSKGQVSTPPHNHMTWAVVVGFEGQELNQFYERTAEGGVAETNEHLVEAGTGVAMLPEDLHSIHIDGGALNFHCYGLALERLTDREYYNREDGKWRQFTNVSSIQEARPNLANC